MKSDTLKTIKASYYPGYDLPIPLRNGRRKHVANRRAFGLLINQEKILDSEKERFKAYLKCYEQNMCEHSPSCETKLVEHRILRKVSK